MRKKALLSLLCISILAFGIVPVPTVVGKDYSQMPNIVVRIILDWVWVSYLRSHRENGEPTGDANLWLAAQAKEILPGTEPPHRPHPYIYTLLGEYKTNLDLNDPAWPMRGAWDGPEDETFINADAFWDKLLHYEDGRDSPDRMIGFKMSKGVGPKDQPGTPPKVYSVRQCTNVESFDLSLYMWNSEMKEKSSTLGFFRDVIKVTNKAVSNTVVSVALSIFDLILGLFEDEDTDEERYSRIGGIYLPNIALPTDRGIARLRNGTLKETTLVAIGEEFYSLPGKYSSWTGPIRKAELKVQERFSPGAIVWYHLEVLNEGTPCNLKEVGIVVEDPTGDQKDLVGTPTETADPSTDIEVLQAMPNHNSLLVEVQVPYDLFRSGDPRTYRFYFDTDADIATGEYGEDTMIELVSDVEGTRGLSYVYSSVEEWWVPIGSFDSFSFYEVFSDGGGDLRVVTGRGVSVMPSLYDIGLGGGGDVGVRVEAVHWGGEVHVDYAPDWEDENTPSFLTLTVTPGVLYQVDELEREVSSLQTDIDELEYAVEDLGSQLEELTGEIADLQSDNEALSQQLGDAEDENEDLTGQVNDLEAQLQQSIYLYLLIGVLLGGVVVGLSLQVLRRRRPG